MTIDGSKFKAANHRDRNFTSAKMKTRMALIEESVAEYLVHLDRKETPRNPRKAVRLQDRIATLKDEMARLAVATRNGASPTYRSATPIGVRRASMRSETTPLLVVRVSRFALIPDRRGQHDVLGWQPAIPCDAAILAAR